MLIYKPSFLWQSIVESRPSDGFPQDVLPYPHPGSWILPLRPLPLFIRLFLSFSLYLSLQFLSGVVPVNHVSNFSCLALPLLWKIASTNFTHKVIFSIPFLFFCSDGNLKYDLSFVVRLAQPCLYKSSIHS